MYSFVFTNDSDPNSLPLPESKYACFLCQLEKFGLLDHFKKYPDHASNLSPELCTLYLTLIAIHDAEHAAEAPVDFQTSTKHLSRLHPKSLFYFQLARTWVENLHLMNAELNVKRLKRGVGQV